MSETSQQQFVPLIITFPNGHIKNITTRNAKVNDDQQVEVNPEALLAYDFVTSDHPRECVHNGERNDFVISGKTLALVQEVLRQQNMLAGIFRLPETPLRGLKPLSVTNRLVDAWMYELGYDSSDVAYREELEGIAEQLLDEGHPDRFNLLTPRNRSTDTHIGDELFIHSLPNLRIDPTHIEYAQILGIDDEVFDVVESTIEAYVALVSQHPRTRKIDGLIEVCRKGIIPLTLIANNATVVSTISSMTGDSQEEIYEALSLVEQLYAMYRTERLKYLVDTFESHTTRVLEQSRAQAPVSPTPSPTPTLTTRIPLEPKIVKATSNEVSEEVAQHSRERLHGIVSAATTLMYDTSKFAELMTAAAHRDIQNPASYLPSMPSGTATSDGVPQRASITIEPYNLWFIAVFAHHKPLETGRFPQQGFQGTLDRLSQLSSPRGQYQRMVTTFCGFVNARTTDVFTEAALVHLISQELLTRSITHDVAAAADDLAKVIKGLDRAHLNSLQAIRETSLFSQDAFETASAWKRLARNPAIQQKPTDHTRITRPTRELATYASCAYHLPFPIAHLVMGDRVVGLNWNLNVEGFMERWNEARELDPTRTFMDDAQNARVRYSTSDNSLSTPGNHFRFRPVDDKHVAKILRNVAARYDAIFEGITATLKSGVMTIGDPRLVGRSID